MASLKDNPTCHLCSKKVKELTTTVVYGKDDRMPVPIVKGKISILHCKDCTSTVLIKRDLKDAK